MSEKDDICPKCGQKIEIGMYPYCKGNKEDHILYRRRDAQPFEPTVYFVNESGDIRFPANDDAKPPKGFEKREIVNLREADKFMKEVNYRENAKAEQAGYNEYRYWDSVYNANADALKKESEHFQTAQGRQMAEMAIDRMRHYSRKKESDCNFYIAPFVYDGVRVKDE